MDNFKNYLVSEFKEQAKGYAAVEFKFNHSVNLKNDKATSKPLRIDIIKVNMKFVDKSMNILHTASIQFENNVIPKTKAKTLVNISPKELENKFAIAKKEICKIIHDELNEKNKDIEIRMNNLKEYIGGVGIIPNEFKGEVIKVEDEQLIPGKTKEFDM